MIDILQRCIKVYIYLILIENSFVQNLLYIVSIETSIVTFKLLLYDFAWKKAICKGIGTGEEGMGALSPFLLLWKNGHGILKTGETLAILASLLTSIWFRHWRFREVLCHILHELQRQSSKVTERVACNSGILRIQNKRKQ